MYLYIKGNEKNTESVSMFNHCVDSYDISTYIIMPIKTMITIFFFTNYSISKGKMKTPLARVCYLFSVRSFVYIKMNGCRQSLVVIR